MVKRTADGTAAETRGAAEDGAAAAPLRRHRDFLLLWGGQTVSDIGSAISTLALPLLAVDVLRASTFEVSAINALTSSAFLLIALRPACWSTGCASTA